jgi:hypothetical protein
MERERAIPGLGPIPESDRLLEARRQAAAAGASASAPIEPTMEAGRLVGWLRESAGAGAAARVLWLALDGFAAISGLTFWLLEVRFDRSRRRFALQAALVALFGGVFCWVARRSLWVVVLLLPVAWWVARRRRAAARTAGTQ